MFLRVQGKTTISTGRESAKTEDQEIIQDFLIESAENLSRVEQEILEPEERPGDGQMLGSIFWSFHTVKGTCGFLGFGKLEAITHQAENLLGSCETESGSSMLEWRR